MKSHTDFLGGTLKHFSNNGQGLVSQFDIDQAYLASMTEF